jgi:hypothetical protein
MYGNKKEEIKAVAAGVTAQGGGIAVPRLGEGIAGGLVVGISGYDCTVCSKKHKVFSPTPNGVSFQGSLASPK